LYVCKNIAAMKKLIAPSLLSADFNNLGRDIEMINKSEADWFHLDIMDGVFVPNLSFGFPVVEHIASVAKKPLDVHLMIIEPDRYLERFCNAGANILTVHWEACNHLHRTVTQIKKLGMKAGVSINPHTPVDLLDDILLEADLVLIMSVNPGYGGQKFIENSLFRISRLRKMIDQKGLSTLIEVDGGVDVNNAASIYSAGADVLVAGNAVFKSENPLEAIRTIKCL
jgi:ribulose-phosphate 3-epimerase